MSIIGISDPERIAVEADRDEATDAFIAQQAESIYLGWSSEIAMSGRVDDLGMTTIELQAEASHSRMALTVYLIRESKAMARANFDKGEYEDFQP